MNTPARRTLGALYASLLLITAPSALAGEGRTPGDDTRTEAQSRAGFQGELQTERLASLIDSHIIPVMAGHGVPGMAVAITVDGSLHYFNYGVASREGNQPVDQHTLFEIGSLSKTFTATLGALAQARGALRLTDRVDQHMPELRDSATGTVRLLDLATYTAGGLPLQFPADVRDHAGMLDYYRQWRPDHAAGTHRLYSNPSIGLFGFVVAKSLGRPFDEAVENDLFPSLGLSESHLRVPAERMSRYAQGYTRDDKPIRVGPGMLDSEAYGVKSTSADLIRFVQAHIDPEHLEMPLRDAVLTTRQGYYSVAGMTQGLGWEHYPYPTPLERLLAGNATEVVLQVNAVTPHDPNLPPAADVLVNKTGSTNGFGGYIAFVPSRRIGIVMLANKNYPNPARIEAAHRILEGLASMADTPPGE